MPGLWWPSAARCHLGTIPEWASRVWPQGNGRRWTMATRSSLSSCLDSGTKVPVTLEKNLQTKLNHPRPGELASELSEGSAGHAGVRRRELRVVQHVDPLSAELQTDSFFDLGVFGERHIEVVLAIRPYSAETGGESADVRTELFGGITLEARVDVEPLRGSSLVFGKRDVRQVAEEDGIAEAQRRPALRHIDTLQLPAADHLGERAGCRTSPSLVLAKGQLVDPRHRRAEGAVLVGDHLFRPSIGGVQVAGCLHQLRPGEGVRRGESGRKALFKAHLHGVIPRVPRVHTGAQAAELRIGPEQLRAGDRGGGQIGPGQQGVERVVHLRVQEVDGRLVAEWRGAQICLL